MLLARDGIECPPLTIGPKVGRQAAMIEAQGSISLQMTEFTETSVYFRSAQGWILDIIIPTGKVVI